MSVPGPLLFARFAYPPNVLGYCGPADSRSVLEYAASGLVDGGLVDLARRFDGAWPYLQLIAASAHIGDPLDRRVVEAYWVGSPLLSRVQPWLFGRTLEDRFGGRLGHRSDDLAALAMAGAHTHHNFHVFGVYPWVGLLRSGRGEEPLRVMDACRIRWGQVLAMHGDTAHVRSQPLRWMSGRLSLGEARSEIVTASESGLALAGGLRPGVWVALHWNWICDVLSPARLVQLRGCTSRAMAVVNEAPRRGPVRAAARRTDP